MNKLFSAICILFLSYISKAADIGLDINSLSRNTKKNGAVAGDGTSTCRADRQNSLIRKTEIDNLTVKELREMLQQSASIQQQHEILEIIKWALADEDLNQK